MSRNVSQTNMDRRLLTIALVLTAEVGGAGAWAEEDSYQPLDANITRVVTGCLWKDGARSGRYRAVVKTRCSPEHCYDDLFLEWLEDIWGQGRTVLSQTHQRLGGDIWERILAWIEGVGA